MGPDALNSRASRRISALMFSKPRRPSLQERDTTSRRALWVPVASRSTRWLRSLTVDTVNPQASASAIAARNISFFIGFIRWEPCSRAISLVPPAGTAGGG